MPTSPQLPLPFPHRPGYAAADFLRAPSNEPAISWLARAADWPGGQLAVWGDSGCGKTHLLHIWATQARAAVVSGATLAALPELGARGIAVDDAGQSPEEPLLHLLNSAREARAPLLLADRLPPARWPVRLPDLASRLRAITAVEIGPPEDSLLEALLMRLLADRQLDVGPPVQAWLLRRLPRSPGALREAAARLDRAALASGRRISRALAADVLSDLLGDAENSPIAG